MSWRPSPLDVWALAALVVMLGGWFIWTSLTANPVNSELKAIAWSAPLKPRDVGIFIDVSARVCTSIDKKGLESIKEPAVREDGSRSWQFWYWGWLHCLDPAEHRVISVDISTAGRCSAQVGIMPGMCIL